MSKTKLEQAISGYMATLEKRIREHPHDFFLEEDLRCISYAILHEILASKNRLRTKNGRKEIRLRANFNPYSYYKNKKNENPNIAFDLAILDEQAGDEPLCVFEFKFHKTYSRWGKNQKYGRASLASFKKDYEKLTKIAPLKIPHRYCIFIEIGRERNPEIDEFIKIRPNKEIEMIYINENEK